MSPLDRVRAVCQALPQAEEKLSHGEPAWFIKGGRQFAMFANHHHDDRVALWCAAPPGGQEALIETSPTHYFRPPYVGVRGWVGIYLDVECDWNEIADIIREGHLHVAPPKLKATLTAP